MIIFPGVDIEMFDIKDNHPNEGEYVLIVLKQEIIPRVWVDYRKVSHIVGNSPFSLLRVCRTKIYKKERIVFFDATGSRHEQHIADDIVCWGRLKP